MIHARANAVFLVRVDPIFWVHHGQIDRLWWRWQQAEPSARLADYSGPIYDAHRQKNTNHSSSSSSSSSSGSIGARKPALIANAADELLLLGLAQDRRVADVMATESALLCYRY